MIVNIRQLVKNSLPRNVLTSELKSSDKPNLLLTFDDGPHSEITHKVLKQLDRLKAKAVFFLVGKEIDGRESIVRDIHDSGHEIGNHSYSHPRPYGMTTAEILEDIRRCSDRIGEVIGSKPRLYRPPYGAVTPSLLFAAVKARLRIVHYSNEGGEWGMNKNMNSDEIAEYLIDTIRPRQIVLLHDDSTRIVELLDHPRIIKELNKFSLGDDALKAL